MACMAGSLVQPLVMETIELGKLEITGTPEKVETGAFKDGRGVMRLHYPEHVITAVMDQQQIHDLIVNLGKALALLQAQGARKN
jgi:hypothetical protein